MDLFCYLCLSLPSVMSVSCSLAVTCWERALGTLVCYVFLCFCHYPIRCRRSGVVLDCIDADLCLLSYLVCKYE